MKWIDQRKMSVISHQNSFVVTNTFSYYCSHLRHILDLASDRNVVIHKIAIFIVESISLICIGKLSPFSRVLLLNDQFKYAE